MVPRFMIIDGIADFRRLLSHHLTIRWPEAEIAEFDPISSGYLPAEFSGAGNDVVLLGNELGDRSGLDILKQFMKARTFPPVAYFGEKDEEQPARKAGAECFFPRDKVRHDALIVRLSDLLAARSRKESTGSLFVGDTMAGIQPVIRGYKLVKKLGVTGHSAVYLAERQSSGRKVVLKVLRHVPENPDSVGAFDRFLQEYELIAELDHPNIVRIHDLGVGDDHAHIVMEYLDGGDLKQRIDLGIPEPTAVEYFRQIASAIASIHKVGILHRDLKPGNIMLRRDNTVALIDFGLAKRLRLEMAITDSGEIFGTPYYMSPEQGHGNGVDERSDIYSLGVIFYEMLTGLKPYPGESAMGIIYKHAKSPIPLLPPRHAQHQALLNLLLAKDPADRLQSAAEIPEWL
ncbi:MAG: protein kinase [Gammaproteobacteria bacterium]|nr:protein kinase [Gammaproteobacteria bacterium]